MNSDQQNYNFTDLNWSENQKSKFIDLWNGLDMQKKKFFFNEATMYGSEMLSSILISALEKLIEADNKLKRFADEAEWLSILNSADFDLQYDNGRYVIPFLPDIVKYRENGKSSKEFVDMFRNFEIELFEELNPDSFISLLKVDIIFLQQKINFLEKIKELYFRRNGFRFKKWEERALSSVEANNELIGDSDLLVGGGDSKNLSPTIHNWLADYSSSVHTALGLKKRGGYDQINYITNSSNTRKLSKENKEILLKIIQFYDWLKSVESESQLNASFDYISQAQDSVENSEINNKSVPVTPVSPNFKPRAPIQEIVKVAAQPAKIDKPAVKPVNIDEVLKNKPVEAELVSPGLKMWDSSAPEMAQGIKKQESIIKAENTNKDKAADIDKKLEDLEKRVKKE
ncbi:MAG: hypothetical protein KIH89_000310 [Candidatus Shapirobacteria bacterium]|nr:hypothetical protein [Candidatus Shapirobacteria bacterium]